MARGKSDKTRVIESKKEGANIVSTALDNLPRDPLDFRRQFVDHADQLEKDKKEAAAEYAAHIKGLTNNFGVSAFHINTMKKLRGMSSDMRARELRQLIYALKVLELTDPQLNLFNDDGVAGGLPIEKDEGSVFDKTGNKAAPKSSETEPVKKLTGAEPPAHVPTPGIPLDEALDKFKGAKDEAETKRAKKGDAPKPSAVAKEQDAPKPASDAAPKPSASPSPKPTARTPAAAAKPTAVRTNRVPTPEEKKAIKKTADKYIPDPNRTSDDDGERVPATYRHVN